MKKITGFFLAILPFFIVVLLFVFGAMTKQHHKINITDVWFNDPSYSIQKKDETEVTKELGYGIAPKNASNPDVLFYVPEEGQSVVEIDKDGVATCKDWGETDIYILAKENPKQVNGKSHLKVTDTKFHKLLIKNEANASYLSEYQTVKLDVQPIPAATDVKHDPTLHFSSSDEKIVSVDQTGELQAHTKGKAIITVSNEASGASSSIEVQVGAGVYLVDFNNPAKTITSATTLDLSNQITTFPDDNISKDPENFTWKTSNEKIASIDDNGELTFHQPGEVDVKVTYKRNPNLVYTSKKIESTCEYLRDVHFSKYTYTTTTSDTFADIQYSTYPTDNQNSLTIVSSDDSILSPQRGVDGKYKFKVNGTGTVMLTASIPQAIPSQPEKTDTCVVTVKKSGTELFLKKQVGIEGYYYSIRDNIDLNTADKTKPFVITMDDENSIASLDDTNGIIHFTKAGQVTIHLTNGSLVNQTCTVTSMGTENKKIDVADTIHLQVGTQYAFNNSGLTSWEPDFGSYADKFDIITSGIIFKSTTAFIPKSGGKIKITVKKGLFESKEVELIIEEKPIAVGFKGYNKGFYPTASSEYKFKESVFDTNSIIPSTACDANGNSYTPTIEYTADPEVATIANDTITFKQMGVAAAKLTVKDTSINELVVVGSTMGDLGKFELEDLSGNPVATGSTITVNQNEEKTLSLTETIGGVEITQDLFDLIKDQIHVSNEAVTVTPTFVKEDKKINFTIKGVDYGDSIVSIRCATFTFYLNVSVSSTVQNVILYYKGNILNESNLNKFFTNKDLIFTIYPTPSASRVSSEWDKIDITLNGTSVKGTKSWEIDLSGKLTTSSQTLKVLKDGEEIDSFELSYKDDLDASDFKLSNSSSYEGKDGCVYIDCNDTLSVSNIEIDGICDSDIYEKFEVAGAGAIRTKNKIYIGNIPAPTPEKPDYDADFTLTYTNKASSQITKQYHLSRETVSKIEFPKNNNLDMTDAKGLQKVHMYGNQSIFAGKETEKPDDFYKLEFNLYDYKGELIEDNDKKKEAFNKLAKSINQDSSYEYGDVDSIHKSGYIKIKFNSKSFLNFEEIYEDAFKKTVDNKNVTFELSTHTQTAKAEYTFVTVYGVNVYTEDGLDNADGKTEPDTYMFVLQTSFGKEGTTKENVPYEKGNRQMFPTIVGNGYTLNGDAYAKRHASEGTDNHWNVLRAFNLILQGVNQASLSRDLFFTNFTREAGITITNVDTHFAYCEIKNFSAGMDINRQDKLTKQRFKNCIFHDNLDYSIKVQGQSEVYIEDCVFYNCGNFALFAMLSTPKIFFKGFVDVYNFHGEEMLKNIMGVDVSFAWSRVLSVAEEAGVVQKDGAGRQIINSFACSIFCDQFYFWNGNEYVQATEGTSQSAEFALRLNGLHLPIVGDITLWTTKHPTQMQHAPDYWKMYDKDGRILSEFITEVFDKVTRKINTFRRVLW